GMIQGAISRPYAIVRGMRAAMPPSTRNETHAGYPAPISSTASLSGFSAARTFGPVGSGSGALVMRWYSLAAKIAVVVEQMVAKRVVGTIAAGSAEPAAARIAITPVGSSVTLEVLIARKRTMALVAVPFTGLSLSSSCIARMPNGVAAFPSPIAFAERLRIIAPLAG